MTKPARSSDATILAVDTTFGACSVAVRAGSQCLARRFERMERGHAEALAPMVDETVRASGLTYSEIDRLGVTTGPGTFTGQRVGLAFMRGLRLALKRPLIGVTSLAAMARQGLEETGSSVAAAIHDARLDQVYFESTPEGVPRLLGFEAALGAIEGLATTPVALAGTAAHRIHERCRTRTVLTEILAPDADWVARLCANARDTGEIPRPLYLREPDAKLPGSRN